MFRSSLAQNSNNEKRLLLEDRKDDVLIRQHPVSTMLKHKDIQVMAKLIVSYADPAPVISSGTMHDALRLLDELATNYHESIPGPTIADTILQQASIQQLAKYHSLIVSPKLGAAKLHHYRD